MFYSLRKKPPVGLFYQLLAEESLPAFERASALKLRTIAAIWPPVINPSQGGSDGDKMRGKSEKRERRQEGLNTSYICKT